MGYQKEKALILPNEDRGLLSDLLRRAVALFDA
jgi:hypothetical protein